MKKWQYKEEHWTYTTLQPGGVGANRGNLHISFQDWLNQHGERGWEMVSMVGDGIHRTVILKRERL